MLPRMRLDFETADLRYALRAAVSAGDPAEAARRVANRWAQDGSALAMFSVRSGFHALLQALAIPPGGEVLVSAVTIRDMARILEAHGLVAVPVDVDMRRLTVRVEDLERRRTDRTRAILIAHLFGSRMDLSATAEFAQQHGLFLIEDCAQAFFGDGYVGHPMADVSMFSFGLIKTATAVGGALLHFRDPDLLTQIRQIEQAWPLQSRSAFVRRVIRAALLRGLSSPAVYTAFVRALLLIGRSHDRLISDSARSFPSRQLLMQIRRRPCSAQLALMDRRLSQPVLGRVHARAAAAAKLLADLPQIERPGDLVEVHTHWVLPILHDQPDDLITHLWRHGFDATRGTSSLYVVPAPDGRHDLNPTESRQAFGRLLYLPFDPTASSLLQARLTQAVAAFDG